MPACCRTKVTSGQASASSRRIRHLRREHLQVEAPAIVGETGDVAPDHGIGAEVGPRREAIERVFVPVQLHAHAAHQRIARKPVELRAHVVDAEIGIGDDAHAASRVRRRSAAPRRPRPRSGRWPSWSAHRPNEVTPVPARSSRYSLDRIVAPDRLVGSEDARLHRAGSARADRPDARYDDGRRRCRSRRSPASKRQHMRDDRRAGCRRRRDRRRSAGSRSAPRSAAGSRGAVASGVSQLTRQARRDSFATASRSAAGSPRSRPSEMITTAAPRA